jgi:hypothetical protein
VDSNGGASASALNDLSDVSFSTTSNSLYVGSGATPPSNLGSDAVNNTAIGVGALNSINSSSTANEADNNTSVGYNAGKSITTGYKNTIMGSGAGDSSTLWTGTSQSGGSATTIKLDSNANTNDDFYNGLKIEVESVSHDGAGSPGTISATISDYNGSTLIATLSSIVNSSDVSVSVSNSSGLDSKNFTIKTVAITTGIKNVIIGGSSGVSSSTASNCIAIGYNSICVSNNEVSLGNGDITSLRCGTAVITTLSDRRDKKDIEYCSYGEDFINKVKPRKFTWNKRVLGRDDENFSKNGKEELGFIAQEMQDAMKGENKELLNLVSETNPERLEIQSGNLLPIIVKALQEMSLKIKDLEAEIISLKTVSK